MSAISLRSENHVPGALFEGHDQTWLVPKAHASELGRAAAEAYASAAPFPHAVVDALLPTELLDRVCTEVEGMRAWELDKRKTTSIKRGTTDPETWGPATREMATLLNSAGFLRYLEAMTGIEGLIPDPYFAGGGVHAIPPGGHLKIHADFNRLERYQLDRRVNVLVYLNRHWEAAWGGNLELWDPYMKACEVSVSPIANRMVAFSTTSTSYHGHPDPLACPEDRHRLSFALYYYTNGRPEGERVREHSTLYRDRADRAGETGKRPPRDLTPETQAQRIGRLTHAVGRRLRRWFG